MDPSIMSGIAGIYFFSDFARVKPNGMRDALLFLKARGPHAQVSYANGNVCFGQTCLSIDGFSNQVDKPVQDPTGRYTLVFNGMIKNRKSLEQRIFPKSTNHTLKNDALILLHWLMKMGAKGLKDVEGSFALGFFDSQRDTLLIARDRYGIKPLYFYSGKEKFLFASEMKALIALKIPRILDRASLHAYLHLNYIPGPWTIFHQVFKLLPGHYMEINRKEIRQEEYYDITSAGAFKEQVPYEVAKKILREKLGDSVRSCLMTNEPWGVFLSGGIDSSIITAIAARERQKPETFSIGFKDEPMFDETRHARAVAAMYDTNHTEFMVRTDDLQGYFFDLLDYTDEPFADSSALAVYILSREVRSRIRMVLSGDGADELFAGYNKHRAEWKIRHPGFQEYLLNSLSPVLPLLPQSRNHFLTNKFRQANRFVSALKLNAQERYWQWAGFTQPGDVAKLLLFNEENYELENRKQQWLKDLTDDDTINEVLLTDMQMVLPYDILTKIDLMPMANSLKVRLPFLDRELVDFVYKLPDSYKIDRNRRKKILVDAFRDELPRGLIHRKKQGFEVPLLRWIRNDLSSLIKDYLLSEEWIRHQGLFDFTSLNSLVDQLYSKNPGEAPGRVWGLVVFQHWWKKFMS